jgi:hypothetical protein
MRALPRLAAVVAAAAVLTSGTAHAAEVPRGPVTATTVAAAQAEATGAADKATAAARAAAESAARLDAAKAAAKAAADKAAATNDPADIAAAATASAAQAAAQQDFDAKTAAAAAAQAASTEATANASREAASFAKVNPGVATESSASLPDDTVMPPAETTDNVQYVGHVRGVLSSNPSCPAYNPTKCPAYSSLNFLHYENLGYDFMVANGTGGLGVWSLKDPEHPKYVSSVTVDQLRQPGEVMTQFWEGENMTVDSRRKLVFMSRDSVKKGLFTIDLKDPWNPRLVSFQPTSLGHTATCLNDCRFVWQVGGAERGSTAVGKRSAVSVTDIRDPEHPFTYANVFEAAVRRTNSTSGSTHSVDVDFDGVAWVSGSGGVRGYWTEGLHKDPVTGQDRYATPYDPLPYAGGQVAGAESAFLHNAYHVPQALGDQKAGDTILITNEDNRTSCAVAGKFIVASLAGTRDASDNVGTVTAPAKMPLLASYSTYQKPGEFIDPTRAVGDCSAHWFTVKGDTVALGNYEQGVRFVDISDPRNPRQTGYFRVPARAATADAPEVLSSNTSAAYWHGRYVYVSDYARGIEILKYDGKIDGPLQPKACWNSCADTQTLQLNGTDAPGQAGGTVGPQLGLTLGAAPAFGAFVPGLAKDYATSTTASVVSTAADATLSVMDASGVAPGHLVNGAFSLPSAVQAKASSAAATGATAFREVSGAALPLLTYTAPTSNDAVKVDLQQRIGAADALRTGAYTKALTFTLSTTTP